MNSHVTVAAGLGRVAVIDIGSNTVRLVVYDGKARVPLLMFNEKTAAGLGRNLAETGQLNPRGVDRAKAALTRFHRLAEAMRLDRIHILATAAVREAEDGPGFADWVQQLFEEPVEVLSGEEEARLAAEGVLCSVNYPDGVVGDMGGGSLDLIAVEGQQFGAYDTLPFGHLKVAELASDGLKSARKIIAARMNQLDWVKERSGHTLYAVGGSWRALAGLFMEMIGHPLSVIDNFTLDAETVQNLLNDSVFSKGWPGNMSKAVSQKRIETLPHAGLALSELIRVMAPETVVFSGFGLREGRFFTGLEHHRQEEDPLIAGCESIMSHYARFGFDGHEVNTWLAPLFSGENLREERVRLATCIVADIAATDHPDHQADHGFFRVLWLPVPGLTHSERAQMGVAVAHRYNKGRNLPAVKKVLPLMSHREMRNASVIGNGLRLAHVLSGAVPGLISTTELKAEGDCLVLVLPHDGAVYSSETVERRLANLANAASFASWEIR
ncbi:MAG: hypothetical protein ACPGO3_09635 [Magnetospiraceae bacterium]